MIDIHNQAILMDFGIVKITGGEKHTATGAVVGTALYLAPEAIRGETPEPRSDQYALGVTLFEILSGRPPFEADLAMTLMMMHLNDPLPDLRELRPEVPVSLIAVIEKTLAKDPAQRYATMAEFASALRGVQATLEITPAVTLPEQAVVSAAVPKVTQPSPAPEVNPPVQSAIKPPVPLDTPLPVTAGPVSQDIPASAAVQPSAEGARRVVRNDPHVAASKAQQHISAGETRQPPSGSLPKLALWGGLAALALVILIGGFVLLRGMLTPNSPPAATTAPVLTKPAADVAATATLPALADAPTSEPSATPTPTIISTLPPSATSTITPSPTPTIPVGVPYSHINAITVNEQGFYVVDYETFEYTEALPGQHVHFFFNTVSVEQAGMPGSGPWKLYGGPRPFDEYRTSDRPASATQLCILVANADHSIQINSGNCFTLPDVNAAVPVYDDPCLAGPGTAYATLAQLIAGQVLLVTGISADEAWWTVEHPELVGQTCWLQRSRTDFSGDLSTLPLSEAPPLPEGGQPNLGVQITQITVDEQGRYVVEFTTSGFTPALPGTHIHFFFDVFAAEQLSGMSGNRLMFGSASPFTGYLQADRPQNAMQLCALVAHPDHSVIEGSGNCFALP